MFLLVASLGFLASKTRGATKVLFGLGTVAVLCTVAGLRATTVGTDVAVYAVPLFNAAINLPLSEFLQIYSGTSVEPLFGIFAWITANAVMDIRWFLAALQMAVSLPVLITLLRVSPGHVGSGMLVYSLVTFGFSLNIMRQSIAAAILLLAFFALYRNQKLRYLFWLLIAAGFHLTGLLGVVFIPILYLFGRRSRDPSTARLVFPFGRVFWGTVAAISLVGTFLLGPRLLQSFSALKESYSYQLLNSQEGSLSGFAILFASVAVITYIFAVSLGLSEASIRQLRPVAAVLALGGVVSQYSLISPELGRIGTMFFFFAGVYFSLVLELIPAERARRAVIFALMLGSSSGYFFWIYVRGGSGDVFPYVFG